ncbi:MAG: hypothetical protein M1840_006648 [Geoglossum simile]|nr:MAG: hypothetical protein M1840_006648 [Geoglossum simile]
MGPTGKTVLTSLLIDECQKIPDVCVAFFYCKHKDPQRSTFVAIARSILLQLLCYKKALLSYIYKEASTSGESSLESSELTKKLLEVALKAFNKVYLIIDGFDECGKTEKKLISTWFQSIINSVSIEDSGGLRCLFVSQADNDTGSLFVGAAILCRSRGDVGGSRTKGHDINKAILRAAYIAAGGLLHWPDANAREVLPLRMYLAA